MFLFLFFIYLLNKKKYNIEGQSQNNFVYYKNKSTYG